MEFRWNDWNVDHASRHGVTPLECEYVVRRGPCRHAGGDKYIVRGRGFGGRLVQVIYFRDDDGTVYVIHARPLNETEKRQYRRSI